MNKWIFLLLICTQVSADDNTNILSISEVRKELYIHVARPCVEGINDSPFSPNDTFEIFKDVDKYIEKTIDYFGTTLTWQNHETRMAFYRNSTETCITWWITK